MRLVLFSSLVALTVTSAQLSGQAKQVISGPRGVLSKAPGRVVLQNHSTLTKAANVTIAGSAPGASSVQVAGPSGSREIAVSAGAFRVVVPLAPNMVNSLHFTGISGTQRGPTTVARVTHDSERPQLDIDGPLQGARVTTKTVDVFGRIADRLSGWSNLDVTVNDRPAQVSVGVGTNGTFFAAGIPLVVKDPPEATEIRVFAKDALGNRNGASVWVTSVPPPQDRARIELVDGNGQSGRVATTLPKLLRVRALDARGRPFKKKLVSFEVTRNDGLLMPPVGGLGKRVLQVHCDDQGIASVRWKLGNEAGAGNHRVQASAVGMLGEVVFCATGTPGPVAQINVANGQDQAAQPGAVIPEPLEVWLHDGFNGIADIPVTFRIVRGGGSFGSAGKSITVRTSRTGHVAVSPIVGPMVGVQRVEATFAGNSRGPARFRIVALAVDPSKKTRFVGRVVDNSQRPLGLCPVDLLVAGQAKLTRFTNASGEFVFEDVKGSGASTLAVRAIEATLVDGKAVPRGSFPNLAFHPVIVAHADNELGGGDVRIPPFTNTWQSIDNSKDVTLTLPGIAGLEFVIKKGSMSLGGVKASPSKPIRASINQVHFDEIPMPAPNGVATPFAWTLQPGGAVFDPPVEIRMPNFDGLAPGALVYFLSFDHDTMRFEIAGSGTVTDDGTRIVSDTNSGIRKAGWGSSCPPYPNVGSMLRNLCGDAAVDAAIERLKSSGRTSVTVEEVIQEVIKEGCGEDGDTQQSFGQPDWSGDYTENNFVEATRRYANAPAIRRTFPAPLRTPVSDQIPNWAGGLPGFSANDAHMLSRGFGHQQWWQHGSAQKRTIPELRDRGWSAQRIRDEEQAWIQNAFRVAINRFKNSGKIAPWVGDAALATTPAIARQHVDTLIALARHMLPLAAGNAGPLPTLPAKLTRSQLEAPTAVSAGTLAVSAPSFIVRAGGTLQLKVVRRRDNKDLTLGSTGTTYFASDGDQVYPLTSNGLLDVRRTSSPLVNYRGKIWVIVRNGNDYGVGQFAVEDIDTDKDGIVDSYERLVGLDANKVNGPDNDSDGDGLRDIHECVIGTSPILRDTDSDGISDGKEIAQGSDPLDASTKSPRLNTSFSCMVGAQRARASLAGSFRLDNIPVPSSPVRCYLIGAVEGRKHYGATEFVDIPFRGEVKTATLLLQQTPIGTPVSLSARVNDPVLNKRGQRTRIIVTASMTVGGQVEVSRRSQGTNYRVSNPEVVSVNPDGFVTALRSGVAYVTVSNEGVTTVVPVGVSLGDPLTTVEGFVRLPDQTPVAGATVACTPGAFHVTTDADGRFEIRGVPTRLGKLTLTAQAKVGNATKVALVEGLDPLPAAITDAGILELEDGVYWKSNVSGVWSDATKWSVGRVPVASDLVVIDRPNATISVRVDRNVTVRGIVFTEELFVDTGAQLTVSAPLVANGVLRIRGGTLKNTSVVPGSPTRSVRVQSGTLDGCTFRANLVIEPFGSATVLNDLVLDGTLTMNGSSLTLPGQQGIFGTGRINAVWRQNFPNKINANDGGTLTIGPSITVTGGGTDVGSDRSSLSILGRIEANQANRVITLRGTWACPGTLASNAGNASIFMRGSGTHTGAFENLGGNLTLPSSETLDFGNGTSTIAGRLTLDGHAKNGTLAGTGNLLTRGILENMTLNVPTEIGQATTATVRGAGLTINRRLTVPTGRFVSSRGSWLSFEGGAQRLDGTGEVDLRYGGAFGDGEIRLGSTSTVTIAAGITVRGAGAIRGATSAKIINRGTWLANIATRTLFVGVPWTNHGELRSAADGQMTMAATGVDNGGTWRNSQGKLTVAGGVDFSATTTNVHGRIDVGGTLKNGRIAGTGSLASTSGRLEDLELDVPLSYGGGATLVLQRLQLDSQLTVGPGTRQLATTLRFDGTQTVAGTGSILIPTTGGKVWNSTANSTVTLGSQITVRGGTCNIGVTRLVNLGVIECNVASANLLIGSPWTSRGTIRATNGTINLSGTGVNSGAITNSGGRITCKGIDFDGQVTALTGRLENAGGTLGNGTLRGTADVWTTGCTMQSLTLDCDARARPGSLVRIRGLRIDKTFRIDEGTNFGPTILQFEGAAQTLAGSGEVLASGGTRARSIRATVPVTVASGVSLRVLNGFCDFSIASLTNHGVLRSDGATARLNLGSTSGTHVNTGTIDAKAGSVTVQGAWTSSGTLSSASGGTLRISSNNFDAGGKAFAIAGRLELQSALVRNASIAGSGTGTIAGGCTVDGVTFGIDCSGTQSILRVRGALQVDSTITLRRNNFGPSIVDFLDANPSVSGTGTFALFGSAMQWRSGTFQGKRRNRERRRRLDQWLERQALDRRHGARRCRVALRLPQHTRARDQERRDDEGEQRRHARRQQLEPRRDEFGATRDGDREQDRHSLEGPRAERRFDRSPRRQPLDRRWT